MNPSTATSVPHASPAADLKQIKQGHSFLFCLCDMRRAVIMLDILGLIGALLGVILIILMNKYGNMEDAAFYKVDGKYSVAVLIAFEAVRAIVCIGGIIGAARFSICPVLLAAAWTVAYIVLSALDQNWISVGVSAVVLYPHFVLCYELAKGIMRRETYYQCERQSCCCV